MEAGTDTATLHRTGGDGESHVWVCQPGCCTWRAGGWNPPTLWCSPFPASPQANNAQLWPSRAFAGLQNWCSHWKGWDLSILNISSLCKVNYCAGSVLGHGSFGAGWKTKITASYLQLINYQLKVVFFWKTNMLGVWFLHVCCVPEIKVKVTSVIVTQRTTAHHSAMLRAP